MSSKGSGTGVTKVDEVSDTSATEEAPVLDPEDSVPDAEPSIPPRSFPFQARMTELTQITDAVADYVLVHEDQIQSLLADVSKLKTDVLDLRRELLQSAGQKELLRQIQLARHVIDSHVKAPHRTGN